MQIQSAAHFIDQDTVSKPKSPVIRQFEISALRFDGTEAFFTHRVPSIPLFDHAATAFARGALFASDNGPVAIEDLAPGDRLKTSDERCATVRWIASGIYLPADSQLPTPLTRIMTDSFGPARPDTCLTLGPAARLWHASSDAIVSYEGQRVLVPAVDFVDGLNAIETMPTSPVQLFHLALDRHAVIYANGIEVESYHPGLDALQNMNPTLRAHYLAMFPHVQNIEDFGPLVHPRLDIKPID